MRHRSRSTSGKPASSSSPTRTSVWSPIWTCTPRTCPRWRMPCAVTSPPVLDIGGQRYTPQRIFCVGRNYAEHAKELGNLMPAAGALPIIFMKPVTSIVNLGAPLSLPRGVGAVHHELELVLALGAGGTDIEAGSALKHVAGATLGLDLTLRDEQARLKQAGSPWELAK